SSRSDTSGSPSPRQISAGASDVPWLLGCFFPLKREAPTPTPPPLHNGGGRNDRRHLSRFPRPPSPVEEHSHRCPLTREKWKRQLRRRMPGSTGLRTAGGLRVRGRGS